jgi:DNA-binding NtrC family response regulator
MARFERGYISNILELAGWNLGKSAQMLGIDQDALSLKIRKYRLLEE